VSAISHSAQIPFRGARGLARGRSIGNVKAHNLRAVLLTLLQEGTVSRVGLARLTGLSTTTITNLITQLLEQGLVLEEGREANNHAGAGRPATLLQLIPSARCAVGVHMGVDTIRAGVSDLFGQLRNYFVIRHTAEMPVAEVLIEIARLVERAIADAGVSRSSVVGVGVGASGLVDVETGVNVLAPNLGWRAVPIRDVLADRLHLPVFVDNNVRAMALAEAMFGAGRQANTLAFVYGRVGVGAGFVVGGQVYRGSRAGAGEIGHTTMIPAGGAPCRCGNTGCLETLISEPEIVRQAQVLAARAPDSILAARLAQPSPADADEAARRSALEPSQSEPIERIFEAARGGDRETLVMLNERGHYIGTALANLVNLVNPDMIILGGLFAAGSDLLLPTIEETMRRRSFAGLGDAVQLRVTTFGRRVGVVGAAALALDEFFYRQET
jgi:glucokinase-like ROK family protein